MNQTATVAAARNGHDVAEFTVRFATLDDVERLVTMGWKFHQESRHPTPYDVKTAAETLTKLIESDSGCLLVCAAGPGQVIGAVGGLAFPMFFNAEELTAQELFWWVMPGKRGVGIGKALLHAFQDWAREVGARTCTMVAYETTTIDPIVAMYREHGYHPLERHFLRTL